MDIDGRTAARALTLGLVAVAALALLAFTLAQGGADGQPTYVGSEACQECHAKSYANWRNTTHGIDFATEWLYNGKLTNKYTYRDGNDTTGMTGQCAVCHVVGYGDTARDGFDPAEPWNSTHNLPLGSIGCENCHGPGSEQVEDPSDDNINLGVDPYAGACGGTANQACHNGTRQYGNETIPGWAESAHASGVPSYVQRVDCAPCHETHSIIAALEGEDVEELPDEPIWQIGCAACHNPHPSATEKNERNLRAPPEEICEKCHITTSEFGAEEVHHPTGNYREATAGYGATPSKAMEDVSCYDCHMYTSPRGTPASEAVLSHSWTPTPQACMVCHSEYKTKEMAWEAVEKVQGEFEARLAVLHPLVEDAKAKKVFAEHNGLWTPAMNTSFYEALFNIGIIEGDGSMGWHNPGYGEGLLDAAESRLRGISAGLSVGGVNGTIVDADGKAIEGAQVVGNAGDVLATTGADGAYHLWTQVGKHNFLVKKDGKVLGVVSDVNVPLMSNATAGQTKMTLVEEDAGEDDGEGMGAVTYAMLAIIIVLIALLAVMATRKKPSPAAPAEAPKA